MIFPQKCHRQLVKWLEALNKTLWWQRCGCLPNSHARTHTDNHLDIHKKSTTTILIRPFHVQCEHLLLAANAIRIGNVLRHPNHNNNNNDDGNSSSMSKTNHVEKVLTSWVYHYQYLLVVDFGTTLKYRQQHHQYIKQHFVLNKFNFRRRGRINSIIYKTHKFACDFMSRCHFDIVCIPFSCKSWNWISVDGKIQLNINIFLSISVMRQKVSTRPMV